MKKICKFIIQVHLALHLIIDIILAFCYKKQMISCGHHVTFKPSTSNIKGIENMSFGNFVRIHKYATLFSTDAKLIIGNKVALGPKVTIMTGNHVTDTIGTFMWDIHTKKEGLDKDINFPKIEYIDCSNMNEFISNLLTKTVNKRNC